MKIYTRQGDQGKTRMIQSDPIPKSDLRVELLGTLDELNSVLGLADSHGLESDLAKSITQIQIELFDWGAAAAGASSARSVRPDSADVARLETEIDAWTEQLAPLTNFILPGGHPTAATLHHARTICRRCERVCSLVLESAHESVELDLLPTYLNRLVYWLFVAARFQNQVTGTTETTWQSRQDSQGN